MRASISFFQRGVIPTLRLSIATFICPPSWCLLVGFSKRHASRRERLSNKLEHVYPASCYAGRPYSCRR